MRFQRVMMLDDMSSSPTAWSTVTRQGMQVRYDNTVDTIKAQVYMYRDQEKKGFCTATRFLSEHDRKVRRGARPGDTRSRQSCTKGVGRNDAAKATCCCAEQYCTNTKGRIKRKREETIQTKKKRRTWRGTRVVLQGAWKSEVVLRPIMAPMTVMGKMINTNIVTITITG